MPYQEEIAANKNNPQALEALYQEAQGKKEAGQFATDLGACMRGEPDNLLLQAWHYRLASSAVHARTVEGSHTNWKLAIPLAVANALVFWGLSDPGLVFSRGIPYLALLAAPLTVLFVMGFNTYTARKHSRRTLLASACLLFLVAVALLLNRLVALQSSYNYLILMVPHLALISWAGVGVALVGLAADPDNRFAFLIKSLEAAIVSGVYLIAGMAFGGITLGMFAALSVSLPDVLIRMMAAGGAGLIPVIAVATIYDPLAEPKSQDFSQGLSKFIGTMMRLLLPLTLGVLVVYIFVIPFNFLQPFKNRDVLIIYNAMLFAILGLLVGATPLSLAELSPSLESALRYGVTVVAFLAALVSLYALSAILYRTATDMITINRLTMIGWNIINIALLVMIIARLLASRPQPWNERVKAVFSLGAVAYVSWTLIVIVGMPFIFH
jgi:hypothetical protein